MIRLCEVLTEEPEGGSAMVPSQLFLTLYRYLGEMDCGEVEVKEIPEEISEDVKQPCLPEKEEELDVCSDKDIDSVIKQIDEAESVASIETQLEGRGVELNWPNIESSETESEIKLPSLPSDEGATSRYGIEVMEPVLEGALSQETALTMEAEKIDTEGGTSMVQSETVDDNKSTEELEKFEAAAEEEALMEDAGPPSTEDFEGEEEMEPAESESEVGSIKVILAEKEESKEEASSMKDSQVSDAKKIIENLDKGGIDDTISLVDLRPTMDRDMRKKIIEEGLEGEEERRLRMEQEAAAEAERKKIEDEAKDKYHMYVPGIGPPLPAEIMDKVEEYILCCAQRQSGMVMPRNLRHFLCPPLDLQGTDRVEGLESLLAEATEGFMKSTGVSQIRDQSGIITLLKSEDKVESQSSLDASMDSNSSSGIRDVQLSSLSYQGMVGGATSLVQLTLDDK